MAGIPQVITEDRASGAQFIDGSLKFDSTKTQYLKRIYSSAGNQKTFTFSVWLKKGSNYGAFRAILTTLSTDNVSNTGAWTSAADEWYYFFGGSNFYSSPVARDTEWYHVVYRLDTTIASPDSDRLRVYVNGNLMPWNTSTSQAYPTLNEVDLLNSAASHSIGRRDSSNEHHFNGSMTQFYFIDGQSLGPENFGFTDPLTNTWRPKKPKITGPNGGQVWSSNVTLNSGLRGGGSGDAAMFDGILPSSYSGGGNFGGIQTTPSETSSSMTIDLGQTFTNVSVTIYPYFASSAATCKVDFGGGDIVTLTGSELNFGAYELGTHTFSSMTLTQVFVTGGGSNFGIGGIAIDGVMLINSTTNNFGPNGFYLPLDGNTPIGKDQSGRGNDWTPVNFGGLVALDKATGALPILNTDGGGKTARPGTRTDPYASSIVMAIPFLSDANDISADIKGSGSNLAVTTSGSPAADSDPTQWYGSSFNVSTNNHISTIGATTTFAFLHQPEVAGTIEGWINTNAVNVQGPWFQTSNGTGHVGVMIRQNSTTNLSVQINRGISGQAISVDSSITVAPNTWYHWAFVKSADGYAQFFLNGVPTGSKVPISTAAGASDAASTNTSSSFAGRIAKNNGEARGIGANICDYRAYTIQKYAFDTPFIPASTNPDVLPDTPSGVSGGSKLTKITDGAVTFDGTGDYLSIPDGSDLELGSGDFTIEGYYYFKNTGSSGTSFWGKWAATPGRSYAFSYVKSSGKYIFAYSTNGTNETLSADFVSSADINRWVHFAAVRNGTSLKVYRDGKEIISHNISTTTIYDSSANLLIGRLESNSNYDLDGFVSNFRLIKGTALYTSNFTPPSAPLTNITNTKLLCCQSNTQPGAAVTSPNMGGVNNGTNWSHFLTTNAGDNFDGSGPKYYAFDGNGSNKAYTGNNSNGTTQGTSFLQVNFPSPISGALRVKCDNGNTVRNVTSGDTLLATQSSGSDNQFVDCGNVSNLSKLRVLMSGGSRPAISVVELDGTTLVDPASPVGNTTATNFNPFTTDIDAVRGQETGYATLNPLDKISNGVLSDGNLKWTCDTSASGTVRANISIDSGKWYWEVTVDNGNRFHAGVLKSDVALLTGDAGTGTTNWAFRSDGYKVYNGSESSINSGTSVQGIGSVIQLAYDADNGSIWFGGNGRWFEGNPSALSSPSYTGVTGTAGLSPFLGRRSGDNGASINFGQKPFKFPPPDGFQPLNAANVRPETVIARPDQHLQANIWSGDNTTRDFDIGMKPDFVWIKCRSDGAGHRIFDSVRGVRNSLKSDSSDAQDTVSNFGYVSSFNNNGFTLTPGGYAGYESGDVNMTGRSYVGWSWKAGGNKNTFNVDDVGYVTAAAAGLDSGTTNPIGASVGTKQGFSIIRYNGNNANRTIAHGLSEPPKFWIYKNLTDNSTNWPVNHTIFGSMRYLYLNLTNTQGDNSSSYWGNMPTSDVLYIGADNDTNGDGDDHIIYAWHDVPGLQKFGKWTNNNSNDGTFIELGFKPALILLKNSDNVEKWYIIDSSRHPYNEAAPSNNAAGAVNTLNSDTNHNEATSRGGHANTTVDILSNGFKIRTTNPAAGEISFGTRNYIYAAWAEAPTVNLYGAQANAR